MAHGEDAWLIPLESVGTLSTAANVGRPRDSNTENVTIVQIHGFDAMPTSVMPKGVEHSTCWSLARRCGPWDEISVRPGRPMCREEFLDLPAEDGLEDLTF